MKRLRSPDSLAQNSFHYKVYHGKLLSAMESLLFEN